MKKIKFLLFIGLMISVLSGCKKNLLDGPNQNNPDFKKVLSNGDDVETLAGGLYNTLYTGQNKFGGVKLMLAVAADNVSISWGNAGMRDMSYEPRNNGWNNSAAYSNKGQTKGTYDDMYSGINTASSIMKALAGGVVVGDGGAGNDRVKAFCRFIQGVGYGNLALIYDRAFLVDETKTVPGELASAVPYDQVAIAALDYLDQAIALCNSSFTLPAAWLGTSSGMSNVEFKKLCNTMAARILAYMPRNKTQLAAVNWARVKTYADAGITSDFNVVNDSYVKWYDESSDYLCADGWGVTSMYVVHMMEPSQPQHWDDSPSFPQPPPAVNPLDKRLESDFAYLNSNWFLPARGYYHFSSYRNKRYDAFYVNADGPKPEIMKAENDMLRAEARAYTADVPGAAGIINTSTRNTRGQMPDVASVLADVVAAIHHERHVEMYATGVGLQFFEMRKLNLLQKGTPLHLPTPAGILETLAVPAPFYTFGYLANADGIGTSNSGWR